MSAQALAAVDIDFKFTHAERKYTSAPDGVHYLLPSDNEERERLELQHQIIKRMFGGQLVLPPIDFSRGGTVLDSGTGAGSWIIDVARTMPESVTLHGIDIESRLFPAPDATNSHFSVHSVTDLPKHWSNTFVLVNQRLLMAALQRPGWETALKEAYRVLAPGGWVQLGEMVSWTGGPAVDQHRRLIQALFNARGLLMDCAEQLPGMLEDAGFERIHVEVRTVPLGLWAGQVGIDARKNAVNGFGAMKAPALKAGGFGIVGSDAEYEAMIDAMEREWDDTPGSDLTFKYIYAQKPAVLSSTQDKNSNV